MVGFNWNAPVFTPIKTYHIHRHVIIRIFCIQFCAPSITLYLKFTVLLKNLRFKSHLHTLYEHIDIALGSEKRQQLSLPSICAYLTGLSSN